MYSILNPFIQNCSYYEVFFYINTVQFRWKFTFKHLEEKKIVFDDFRVFNN